MHTFAERQQELGLKPFLESSSGTLYTARDRSGWPTTMVRHFDRDLPPTLVRAYAEIIAAADEWLAARDELAQLVEIQQPNEIGSDFIARPYHVYEVTTRSYSDTYDPPPELQLMRDHLRTALASPARSACEEIVREALRHTLLEPSSRVYFDDRYGQFIVVEPKIGREAAEKWVSHCMK